MQIKIWFQNRRTKWKKQNPGSDINSPSIIQPTPGPVSLLAAAAAAAASGGLYGPPGHHGAGGSVNGSPMDIMTHHHGGPAGSGGGCPVSAGFGAALYLNSLYSQAAAAAAVSGSRIGSGGGGLGTLKQPFPGLGGSSGSACDPVTSSAGLYRCRPFISPIF